ncbi:hypothetical protein [Armatimonas rosea]|uniref:Uncharacterized protein n=1 Tax=Armatimonas rosea TaxID=685828 RepID=A0A7W9SSP9_ARMRO|nr:hypothetical protein [Armatimonas rosea]MBB6052152.1 hypothetical protein [Armatimonas rosea]
MNYPLTVSFKLLALLSQLTVTDASGNTVCYLKRKFSWKEKITIFTDSGQTEPLYHIESNKAIALSPVYTFVEAATNKELGTVTCNGWKSIWNIDYQIRPVGMENATLAIDEENPWIKVIDHVVGEIPIIGLATAFLFHPAYLVKRGDTKVLRLVKKPSLFESKFELEKHADLSPDEEKLALLGLMVMVLAARSRG